MSGNLLDYLKPVDDAGDKSYKNGKQEFSGEDEKKANDLIKQIAYQKQLDLERGNTEAILAKLKENTPEAAIYRALLLQQLEQYQKEKKEKGEDKKEGEGKKDEQQEGIFKKVGNWLKGTSWKITKTLAIAALAFLASEGIRNYGTIRDKGWKAAWEKTVADYGVAKTPEFAEQTGETTAALNGDVVKRNVKFSDLNEAEKKATMNFAMDHMDKGTTFDTTEAEYKLVPFFKRGKEYDLKLPEGANPLEYDKGYTMILNTGGKDGTTIPVTPLTIGQNAYNSMFKISDLKTEITPEDNWFTGNKHLRAIDNGAWHINALRNYYFPNPDAEKLKRPIANDITPDMYPSSKRPKMSIPAPSKGVNVSIPETSKGVELAPTEAMPIAPKGYYTSADVVAKEVSDLFGRVEDNQRAFNANILFNSNRIGVRFKPDPWSIDKQLKILEGEKLTAKSAHDLFEGLNPGTGYGILDDDMTKFWKDAMDIRDTVKDPKDRIPLYKDLIQKRSTTGLLRIPGVYNPPIMDPNFVYDRKKKKRIDSNFGKNVKTNTRDPIGLYMASSNIYGY